MVNRNLRSLNICLSGKLHFIDKSRVPASGRGLTSTLFRSFSFSVFISLFLFCIFTHFLVYFLCSCIFIQKKLSVYRQPSVLWHCWLGIRKSIWPVKIEWWGVVVVICLEWGLDCLHMVQLMPLHPKTASLNPDWFYLSGTGIILVKEYKCFK